MFNIQIIGVNFSSSNTQSFPASGLLENKKWLAFPDNDGKAKVVLSIEPSTIDKIEMKNAGAEHITFAVGKKGCLEHEYQVRDRCKFHKQSTFIVYRNK